MKKIVLALLFGIILNSYSVQHTPTWTDGIACIIYSHCSPCHNDQGIAPFPLMTYEDAYVNRFSIAASVQALSMPPFPPSQEKVQYAHDNTLDQHEIDEIVEWVDNFAPYGDPNQDPDQPVYDDQYELDDPDLILRIPEFEVNTANDLYRVFVLPVNNSTEKYIKTVEIYPGNRDIVHHVLAFQDASNIPQTRDANDPGPGYTSFGGTGSPNSTLFSGYVPGQKAFSYADGMGAILEPNTNILLQIHYPGGTFDQKDSTEIRIKFSNNPLRNVFTMPVLNHSTSLINGPLFIPANAVKTFYSEAYVPQDISLTAVLPHMHLIGESIKAFAVTPQNDTLHLVDIPKWDFHWQGFYQFEQPMKVPAGSRVFGEARYNNTSSNIYNPNNPPKDVSLGEGTEDEMMLIYFNFATYLPGDENIIIDTSSHFAHHSSCYPTTDLNEDFDYSDISLYPNPVDDLLFIDGTQENVSVMFFGSNGKQVLSKSYYDGLGIDVSTIPPGAYFARIETRRELPIYRKFIVAR